MQSKPWLSSYPEDVPPSLEYPKVNLAHFLIDSATTYPESVAMEFLGKRMTYRALLASARRFANALLGMGLKKGDRIAIMLPNCPQTVIAFYGALMAGGIVVMTNPLYMPRELEHQLKDSGARFIVALDQLWPRLEKVMPLTELEKVIITGIKDYLPFPKNVLYGLKLKKDGQAVKVPYDGKRVISFAGLLRNASETPVFADVDAEQDLALIQYTGGTTGLAKGVMLTHLNLIANTLQCRKWLYKTKGCERFLCVLPFFHVFGLTTLLLLGIYSGGTLILLPRFEAGQVLKMIHTQKPTMFPGAPTMYVAIINHPEIGKYDLTSIRACISGAAPLPLQVQETFERITGGKLIEGYGLTEASPVTHANNIWEKRKHGSIGIPFPDTEAKIVAPDTLEDVPIGEIGELAVRGPQVMKGYWRRPLETEKVLKDGWLLTGDMARMDEEGFFYIIDRRKDIIIAGGYNIYPREIEEVLYEHPDVEEASVAGIADPYRGETVKAYIVLRPGAAATEQDIDRWCRERLAAYKVPKHYEFRGELPKTMAGKVLRRKLIEEEQEKSKSS